MSEIPPTLRYTEDHEWVSVEDGVATIGITFHAQDQLGDVVYLGDFPDEGDGVEQADVVGVVESVKATSDIYSPLTGEIVEINAELDDSPELVNKEPYDGGWLLKVKIGAESELDDLMSADDYKALIEQS
jgi:glycine cleavage system H protein